MLEADRLARLGSPENPRELAIVDHLVAVGHLVPHLADRHGTGRRHGVAGTVYADEGMLRHEATAALEGRELEPSLVHEARLKPEPFAAGDDLPRHEKVARLRSRDLVGPLENLRRQRLENRYLGNQVVLGAVRQPRAFVLLHQLVEGADDGYVSRLLSYLSHFHLLLNLCVHVKSFC